MNTPDRTTRDRPLRSRRSAGRAMAASLAVIALAAPAAAQAVPSLLNQGKTAMQQANAQEEKQHLIPFKAGTKFTITCKHQGTNILCSEHAGQERCVKGRPWLLLSDLFPVIKGRIGQSLTYGLLRTSVYCKH